MEVKDDTIFSTYRVLPSWPAIMAAAEHEANEGNALSDDHLLPLLLLLSRAAGESDPWSHFIDSLPHPQQPSALTATRAELMLLPNCYAALVHAVVAHACSLHADCKPLIAALAASGMVDAASVCSADAFVWAHGHVNARMLAFGGQPCACVIDDGRHGALVPVLDLINYSPVASQSVERSDGGWRLIAGESYRQGEQIFIDYEIRGNLRLWLQFGFALEEGQGGVSLAAFDMQELTDAVSSMYSEYTGKATGRQVLVDASVLEWRRWMGELYPCLLLGPGGQQQQSEEVVPVPASDHVSARASVPTPGEWQRDNLFILDLADSFASDKLNEALIAAVGIGGANLAGSDEPHKAGMAGGGAGIASQSAATDAIITQLLRSRTSLLTAKLDECGKIEPQEAVERAEPLRVLMASEAAAARQLLAAIDDARVKAAA